MMMFCDEEKRVVNLGIRDDTYTFPEPPELVQEAKIV